jgi:hypothetical protein
MGSMELEYRFVDRWRLMPFVTHASFVRRRGRTKLAAFKGVFEESV